MLFSRFQRIDPPPARLTMPAGETAPFADRVDAGRRLAETLHSLHRQSDVTVVGVPKGGVIVAAEIARILAAPLSVWVAQKLRAPAQPGTAIGSVGEDGEMIVHEQSILNLRVQPGYLVDEVRQRRQEVARRARLYRGARDFPSLFGRRVVLVDDGLATGATLLAALRGVRRQQPASIVVAVPVAPAPAALELAGEAGTVRTLAQPLAFGDIGQFYVQFHEVTDDEVMASLG